MDDIQPERLQRQPLIRLKKAIHRFVASALFGSFIFLSTARGQVHPPPQKPVVIPRVHSGSAVLQQKMRTTLFLFTPKNEKKQEIPLTHPSDYPQGFNPPYAAKVIAEVPNQLLIFTDTFASNPGNIQGRCGASPTGERFLHVVSLVPPARESLSVLIESCLLDIELRPGTPVFDPKSRTLTLQFDAIAGQAKTVTYQIAPDNSVKQ